MARIGSIVCAVLLTVALAAPCLLVRADEADYEIITSCYNISAEWGAEVVDMCVRENKAIRAQVAEYPQKYSAIVARCKELSFYSWARVKSCIDQAIATGDAGN